jgi:DNA-binding transcriptional LysR family regulator
VTIDLRGRVPARVIGLVWHGDRHRSAAAEAFVDTALEVCAELSQGLPVEPRGPREPVPQSA